MPEPPSEEPHEPSPSPIELGALVGAFGALFAVAYYSSGARHGVRSALAAFLATVIVAIAERRRLRLSGRDCAFSVILAVGAALAWVSAGMPSTNKAAQKVTPPPKHTPPPPVKPAVVYLDDLAGTGNDPDILRSGAVHLDGRRYAHAVSLRSSGGVDVSADNPDSVSYTLPGQFTYLRTLVGYDRDITNAEVGKMGVEVVSGSHVLAETALSTDSGPCAISVRLNGARSVALATYPVSDLIEVSFADSRVIRGGDARSAPSAPACP